MNSCEKFDSLIEAYLDGALSDEENKQFEEHISSCEKCRESFEIAKKMHNALKSLDYEIEVPSDFCAKLHEKIKQLPAKKSIYTYSRRIGAIAACVVLAVVVAKNGIDTNLTKNANELKAQDTAGPVIAGVITEKAEDENVTPTNTTETTKDKQEHSEEISNIQRKTTETGKVTQPKKEEAKKKAAAETVIVPSPAPEVLNDIIKPQQTEEEPDAAALEKEVSDEEITTESKEPETVETAVATQLMPADTAKEKPEPTVSPEAAMQEAEKAPTSGGGSGGGGSSASVSYSARRMTVLELKVEIENIAKANEMASKYAPMKNGVYTMSAATVKKLLSELEAAGISASLSGAVEDEEISFTVTAK